MQILINGRETPDGVHPKILIDLVDGEFIYLDHSGKVRPCDPQLATLLREAITNIEQLATTDRKQRRSWNRPH